MPESVEQWLFWAFNGTLLALLWYIRTDIVNMRRDMAKNAKNNHKLYTFLMQINARCAIFHPDRPALTPPEWED